MVPESALTVTQLVILKLLPHQNFVFFLVWFLFHIPLFTNCEDQSEQGNSKQKSHQLALATSSVTNYGSRNVDSQTLWADENLEVSRSNFPFPLCCWSVNMTLTLGSLYTVPDSGGLVRGYDQETDQDPVTNLTGEISKYTSSWDASLIKRSCTFGSSWEGILPRSGGSERLLGRGRVSFSPIFLEV